MSSMTSTQYCLYFYADILGYRNLLEQFGVEAFHEKMTSVLLDVEATVDKEKIDVDAGSYRSFIAFDTIMVFKFPVDRSILNWGTLDKFCYFASLIYLRLFVQYDILVRGVIGATEKYRIDDRVVTIAEIDRMYKLEKAQDSATVLLDLYELLQGPFPPTTPDEDPFFWFPVQFKTEPPIGLAHGPMEPEENKAVLRLLNPRTVSHLREHGLSFCAAVDRLKHTSADLDLPKNAQDKLRNTLSFFESDLAYYRSQDTVLNAELRRRTGKSEWTPVP